jgi:hypothetical protein
VAIPQGLVKCPVCGEYRGNVRAGDLNWGLSVGIDPEKRIGVSCLCTGILCGRCGKNKIHRPCSNSYEEDGNCIGHWPYFSGMMPCAECRRKADKG